MTDQRVAGLVWKEEDGIPFILTHTPAKSSIENYSVTTVTGTLKIGNNALTTMANTMFEHLGIERSRIIEEHIMSKPMESLSKVYRWYFMKIDTRTTITMCPTEIQDYSWNPPAQIPLVMEKMRAGRRYMFEQALAEACKRNIFQKAQFPFLQ